MIDLNFNWEIDFLYGTEKKENREKKRYLLGESMGGAVALLIHRKQPDFWDGAILVAPMCKVISPLFIYLFI